MEYKDLGASGLKVSAVGLGCMNFGLMCDQAATDAVRSARPVALDAMSATERKVVHEYLKDRDDVETYSEGTEPDRHLVVAPL